MLNAVIVKNTYQVKQMDYCLDSLGEAHIFSAFEVSSWYCKLEIDSQDGDKMMFTSHHGLYSFLQVPFGLKNAASTFQRTIYIVLSTVKSQLVLFYFDDVSIFKKSVEEHLATYELYWDYWSELACHWNWRNACSSRIELIIRAASYSLAHLVYRLNWSTLFANYSFLQTWVNSNLFLVSATYMDILYQTSHALPPHGTATWKKTSVSPLSNWTCLKSRRSKHSHIDFWHHCYWRNQDQTDFTCWYWRVWQAHWVFLIPGGAQRTGKAVEYWSCWINKDE